MPARHTIRLLAGARTIQTLFWAIAVIHPKSATINDKRAVTFICDLRQRYPSEPIQVAQCIPSPGAAERRVSRLVRAEYSIVGKRCIEARGASALTPPVGIQREEIKSRDWSEVISLRGRDQKLHTFLMNLLQARIYSLWSEARLSETKMIVRFFVDGK